MSVGIIGGGLLGLRIADRLAGAGVPVTVYEAGRRLGGLAGTTNLGGVRVDRFYHAVTRTDERVISLAEELGLPIRWRGLGVGFFHDGQLCSMSTPREVLRFPGLTLRDKARLAEFVLRCGRIHDHAALDEEPIEAWTRRMGGNRLWERLWRPLLESKFDGRYDDLPATYLWSRTRRTAGTRDRKGREVMGWVEGGYQAMVDRLAARIRARGGEVHTSTPVRRIVEARGRATGVVLESGLRSHDHVVSTLLRPALEPLLGGELATQLGPDRNRYLGVVCVVARLRRSVSPYYALNITDRSVPITSVVETTHVVDPDHVRGHLLYVPRYVEPDSPDLERSDAHIVADYLAHVRTMFPRFDPAEDIIAADVARARIAEPIHPAGVHSGGVEPAEAPGLTVASSGDVYPDIVHGQAIFGVAERVATKLLADGAGATTEPLQRSAA